jgi:branched-chain amino acid transport system permease protein
VPDRERARVIPYLTAIATLVGVRALLTLGLNVQWGLAGLVNLGAVAFFGVGAYTSALLAVGGAPLAFAWPAAVVLAAAAGAGVAMVALRLREDYLAIVTLGFGEVLRLFLLNEAWLTHGANGVTGIPRPLHGRFPGHYDLFYLVLVLTAVALVYAALERLRRSPFGRVLRAIREDEIVAAVAGKPVFRFKVQAFALGAAVAGLAGILFAHYLAYVEPNMFLPQESLFVWLALILGGSGNNRGALLGSVVLLGLLEGSRFAKDVIPFLTGVRLAAAQQILVGVVLVVLMIRRPEGLLPEKPGTD